MPDSDVHGLGPGQSSGGEPASAPSHASSAEELDDNPFASLEQETTRTFQVSDELLEITRENAAAANGATRAYEVPAELLEMARRKKLARAAASLKPAPPQPASGEAAAGPLPEVKEVTQSGPRLAFSELSDEDRAWVESALHSRRPPKTEPVEASHVRAVQRSSIAPKKNGSARWVLISLFVVATSALAIQYARLMSTRSSSSPAGLLSGAQASESPVPAIFRSLAR